MSSNGGNGSSCTDDSESKGDPVKSCILLLQRQVKELMSCITLSRLSFLDLCATAEIAFETYSKAWSDIDDALSQIAVALTLAFYTAHPPQATQVGGKTMRRLDSLRRMLTGLTGLVPTISKLSPRRSGFSQKMTLILLKLDEYSLKLMTLAIKIQRPFEQTRQHYMDISCCKKCALCQKHIRF
ncbi:hypothetical protein B0H10DRAFT_2089759 [Mycena sp. CBHHK59/15]|nr:hypothetical protein B0H10DRAFT_2102643 [Mycena sp. CBHHK59/15]KAJ6579434.1 hypothetical protein B0H10DRAFT_2198668 [Mycena sp. CBHHK59/15]KAJ6595458.1 hypothetical protein B0H10DRAFT_2089759 [Mycena sp. CBHHK59/15]